MNEENVKIISTVLDEWAQAIRGDWGSIDGRTCRSELQNLSSFLMAEEPLDIEYLRWNAEICPEGKGHWLEWCRDDGCIDYIVQQKTVSQIITEETKLEEVK